MRKFADDLRDCEIMQRAVAQLPWRTNISLLDKPTLRFLLFKGKNRTVVEYSLAGFNKAIGVAEWQNQLKNSLPENLKISLPSIEEIEKELE